MDLINTLGEMALSLGDYLKYENMIIYNFTLIFRVLTLFGVIENLKSQNANLIVDEYNNTILRRWY